MMMEARKMAQPLFVGSGEELLERKEEFAGMRLRVYATSDEDVDEEHLTPPLTICNRAHLEELLLAGVDSPKEEVIEEEWSDLHREVRERLATRKQGA